METTNTTQDVSTQEGVWVPISRITVPEDARPHTQEDVDSRSVSMAREGQEQNALLSKEGDKLVLVYGHGRLLSAQKLGWEKLRCDIKEGLNEDQKLKLALVENAERENESPFYTAGVYKKLMDMKGLTQEQLATELGKTKNLVEKYATLGNMAPEVRQNHNALWLSLRQCLAIAKLTKMEDQLKVIEECATQDLSGKALEARVKQLLNPSHAKEAGPKPVELGVRFTWKGEQLIVRGALNANHGPATMSEELNEALNRFVEEHPRPELKKVSQAA